MWLPQMISLASEFRVIAMDLPGHGSRMAETFSLESAVGSIADVIVAETAGPVVVVGLSTGGYVTLEFCARFPGMANGVVLSGCSAEIDGFIRFSYLAVRHAIPLIPERWLTWADSRRLRHLCGETLAARIAGSGLSYKAVPTVIDTLARRRNFHGLLAAFPGAMLIVNGAKDHIFRAREVAFLCGIPNATRATIPDAGHLCNLDRPDTFNAVVREFAASLSR
jgi:pimeloyl-ACP methyl ester carboxylesterase